MEKRGASHRHKTNTYALEILRDEEEEEAFWTGGSEKEFQNWRQWLVAAISLLLFVGLLSAYLLLISISHHKQTSYSYFFTTVILLSELGKLLLSLLLALLSRWLPVLSDNEGKRTKLFFGWRRSLHFAVPALLYTGTTNVIFLILLRMDPSSFALLSQTGVLFVAAFTRVLLRRALDRVQWLSLIILAAGTVLTQLDTAKLRLSLVGLLLTALYALLDALATVYTEFRLKHHKGDSIHIQHIHLFFYSSCCSALLFFVIHFQSSLHAEGGFFAGYTGLTLGLVGCLLLAGLVNNFILKWQSSIARMFCISGAIVITAAVSSLILEFRPSLLFGASFLIVVCAVLLYRHRDMTGLRFLLTNEEYDLYYEARVQELVTAFPNFDEEDHQILSSFATTTS